MTETAAESGSPYIEIDHPWVSHKHVPIYEWTFPPETSDEDLEAFVRAREDWATQRRMFGEHLKRFERHDVQWNGGSALVVPRAWLRGLVTAVFWISPPKVPHQAFAKRTDALQWAQLQLDAKVAESLTPSKAQSFR